MNYIYNMLFSGIYGIVLEQQHEITLNYTALRLPYSQLLTASGDTRYLKPWFGGRPSMENSWRTGMLAVVVLQNKFLLIDQFALTFTVVSQLRFDLTLPILQYFLTLSAFSILNTSITLSAFSIRIFFWLSRSHLLLPSPIHAVDESETWRQIVALWDSDLDM